MTSLFPQNKKQQNEWEKIGVKGILSAIFAGIFGFTTALYLIFSGYIILNGTSGLTSIKIG